jgi:ACS family hexuronate transporter-like MFS transporter
VLGKALRNFRWLICGVLLLGVTKNYMDRQVIGILKNSLQRQFSWSEVDYGNLVFAFQLAYAIGMVAVGRLIDTVGTRLGYALAMAGWSLAAMAHGLANSLTGFIAARFALGFGEAGVFPASLKAVAEWFPKKERALATGIFNAGTNLGAVVTPLIVPWVTVHWGWRWAFLSIGALGFIWLVLWWAVYRTPELHPRCSPEELQYILSDRSSNNEKIGWLDLLPHRQTWAFAAGKFIIDPIWWFYLFWIPDFLQRMHGVALLKIGPPLVVIYLIADAGSIGGGWLSSALIRQGKSINMARKTAMLVCAVCVLPIIFAPSITSLWEQF